VVISLRNTEHPAKRPVKPFIPAEQQVEKLTEANIRCRGRKQQTLSGKSAIVPALRQEINEHIFTVDNGEGK
jgi:hypothetical protein